MLASLTARAMGPGIPHNKFMDAMLLEHCAKYGHNRSLTTGNYHITTTPEKEWAIVVDNAPPSDDHTGHGRTIRPLQELMQEPLVAEANLIKEEVVAVVLYTGPLVRAHEKRDGPCSRISATCF
jgi:hypothetical protein